MKNIVIISLCLFGVFVFYSCISKEDSSIYNIDCDIKDEITLPLMEWNICGPLSLKDDSLLADSVFQGKITMNTIQRKKEICTFFLNDLYTPKYGQIDLKELYDINPKDTTRIYKDKYSILGSTITTPAQTQMYLEVKHSMPITIVLNRDTLERLFMQGLNLYRLKLKEGENSLYVKAGMDADDLSLETTLYDSLSVARLYAEGQSGNIVFPLISAQDKIVTITNDHQNVIDAPTNISFIDVYGKVIYKKILVKDSIRFTVPYLESGKSYTCEMTIGNTMVRQSVLCGNCDEMYEKYMCLRNELPTGCKRADEIDQILFRLNFLLEHPSRQDDWWWQFKIAPLTYQLEHIFAHINGKYGQDDTEPNIKFMTYHSELDSGMQRYVLATPNKVSKTKRIPLVVLIRPIIDTHRHIFSCPQIARQWAVNQMQSLANRYGYIVMMPEMRTYLDEDISPMAEAELKLAILDVKKYYDIDDDRIYLHANCSGGSRALKIASANPEMFAAIGLYAPKYDEELLKNQIRNIKHIPVMIHYDPLDKHSPYIFFKNLIKDCKDIGIPLKMSIKRNSGAFYNVVLTGEEAFDFFKDKKRTINKSEVKQIKDNNKIWDFYSRPFVYVYNSSDTTRNYNNIVDSIKTEYENCFYTSLPLKSDTKISVYELKTKNLFLIGSKFVRKEITELYKNLNCCKPQSRTVELNVYENIYSKGHKIIVYDSEPFNQFQHSLKRSWLFCNNRQKARIISTNEYGSIK